MSVSKIKSIAIILLLILNVFFLVVIVVTRAGSYYENREALENACEVLRENGIEVSPRDIHANYGLARQEALRDTERQEEIVLALLGVTDKNDLGGNIYSYTNPEKGEAIFYNNGEFSVEFFSEVFTQNGTAEKTTAKLLKEMKLEAMSALATGEAGAESVEAQCVYRGVRVMGCFVRVDFKDGAISAFTGRLVSKVTGTEQGETIISPLTALLRFLNSCVNGEVSCTEITRMEAVYQITEAGVFGYEYLAPAYLLTTDSGQYTVGEYGVRAVSERQ